MANDTDTSPWVIDTVDATGVATKNQKVRMIRWVGATTAGHRAAITDQNDRVFWDSYAAAANHIEQSPMMEVRPTLKFTVLGSGKLYIYFDVSPRLA